MDQSLRSPIIGSVRMYVYLKDHPEGCTIQELMTGADVTYENATRYLHRMTRAGIALKRQATWTLSDGAAW